MNLWTTYGLAGILIFLAGLVLFGQARPARLPGMFLVLAGLILLAVPIIPGLAKAVLPNKIRLFMGAVSFLHLYITLESVRRNRLKERYALLWVGTGLVLLGFAVYPNVIGWLVQITGMHYTSAIMVVLFAFMILIAFHVSLVLSKNESDRRLFAHRIAFLELRLETLENHLAATGTEPPRATTDATPSD